MLVKFCKSTLIAAIFLFHLIACSDSAEQSSQLSISEHDYINQGDLPSFKKHKELRVLSTPLDQQWLPRSGPSFADELELTENFANALGLKAVLVPVEKFADLIPALLAGKGDIIASNFTITSKRKQQLAFSVPLAHSKETIVLRKNDSASRLQDLNGRRIAYQSGSSFEETIKQLQQRNKKIQSEVLPGELTEDQIIDLLNKESIDLTIFDSNHIEILKTYRDDFKTGPTLTEERNIAWAIRPDNPQLLEAANNFLNTHQLSQRQHSLYKDDLEQITKRKTLRVITRNNAASYFLWKGELLGFEYELVKAFARQHKLRIEIIVAPSHDAQIPMLLEGKGDIIASFMSITERRKQQGVTFSRFYHKAPEVIISRSKEKPFSDLKQLNGRRIHVRKSSAYWDTLQSLLQQGYTFELLDVNENMETEEVISKVASGDFDLTVADQHLLNIELTWRDDIQAAYSFPEEKLHAWAARAENPKLIAAVNSFLKKQYKSLLYNITYNKYFVNPHNIKQYRDHRIDINPDSKLSPYEDIVKKYAKQYQFDWRLLTAQMYQESRFDPDAKSWAGAKGLMQVMPGTAKELAIKNLHKPEAGIHAGVKYMEWVRQRFETDLKVKDRMWFTLAAYNAGAGHVKDARRLAAQLGLNPNRWFDNVENAMLLLAKRQYAKNARHGYVRGSEPVQYVRKIRDRYHAYLQVE